MISVSHWGMFEKPTAFNRSFQASMQSPYTGQLPQNAANAFYQNPLRTQGNACGVSNYYQNQNFGKLD